MDKRRRIWAAVLVFYGCCMLLLLFFRELPDARRPYTQQMFLQLNLAPLRTIRLYLRLLGSARFFRLAVINLVGNVVMFLPLGALLPAVFSRLRRFCRTLAAGLLAVLAVELLQLFTLLGSCDIDDLILNLVGIALGYGLWRLLRKKAVSD